jgi:hypothetical protein
MLDQTGNLTKLNTKFNNYTDNNLENNLVLYNLEFKNNSDLYSLNQYIGTDNIITIEYLGEINCINCARKTAKSFNQGYCFPCFRKLANCDSCIMSPERCHYYLGTCREPEWGLAHCMIDHVVYLANSSGLKVGLTRATQIPIRWIDQGATQALPIAKVSSRYQAGLLEFICKEYITDRTDWRAMLKGLPDKIDLYQARDQLYSKIKTDFLNLQEKFAELGNTKLAWCLDEQVTEISYPIVNYPSKITSLNLEALTQVSGKLNGIKGQYLILDTGVINIRKYTGYKVRVLSNNN